MPMLLSHELYQMYGAENLESDFYLFCADALSGRFATALCGV